MLLHIFLEADGCGQHIAVFGHVSDVAASRALFVLHVGSTVAIGACQAARSVVRAVTAVATMIGRTLRRGKANRARAIGVVSPAWQVAIVSPGSTVTEHSARALHAVD